MPWGFSLLRRGADFFRNNWVSLGGASKNNCFLVVPLCSSQGPRRISYEKPMFLLFVFDSEPLGFSFYYCRVLLCVNVRVFNFLKSVTWRHWLSNQCSFLSPLMSRVCYQNLKIAATTRLRKWICLLKVTCGIWTPFCLSFFSSLKYRSFQTSIVSVKNLFITSSVFVRKSIFFLFFIGSFPFMSFSVSVICTIIINYITCLYFELACVLWIKLH